MIPSGAMDSYRILLVEDDVRLANLVHEYLSQHEFEVDIAARGDTAVANFDSAKFWTITPLQFPDPRRVCSVRTVLLPSGSSRRERSPISHSRHR